jgi:hypothetical protein
MLHPCIPHTTCHALHCSLLKTPDVLYECVKAMATTAAQHRGLLSVKMRAGTHAAPPLLLLLQMCWPPLSLSYDTRPVTGAGCRDTSVTDIVYNILPPALTGTHTGYSDTALFADNLLAAQEGGAAFVTLHARTKAQTVGARPV